MRLSFAAALMLASIGGAAAQPRAAAISAPRAAPPIVVPSAGALGGNFGSAGRSRPLGGFAPAPLPTGTNPQHHPGQSSFGRRYVGLVYYVPNAFDYPYDSSSYSTLDAPANPLRYSDPGPQPQPPVIINQYFGSRGTAIQPDEAGATPSRESVNPGDPLTETPNYYLIAYKDRSVYTALAYWLEGGILHYVTTQNTHNQASLSLIDLDQTTRLNAGNNVPFSLAGK